MQPSPARRALTLSEKFEAQVSTARALLGGDWVNLANMFTALRVLLVPPIILLLLYEGHLPYNIPTNIVTGLVFIAAALTDKADGYFARKHNTITRVGQFFDPLADKLLMLPVMATLWYVGMYVGVNAEGGQIALTKPAMFPLWVLLLVMAREFLISGIRVIGARRSISFPASWSGKVKMFSQVVVVSVLIFFPGSRNDPVVRTLVFVMAAITAYSGIDYVARARREIFKRPSGANEDT
jgi:CDP-diacylglycerol--glycerol-3-phosphate 3-phosphatidyltransferase